MTDTIKPELDIYEWLRIGLEAGFVGPGICETHDGFPMSEAEEAAYEEDQLALPITPLSREEAEEFEEGSDPCIHILRLYASPEHKAAVEENHAPSNWRQ
ncbi:hypothetical protein [Leifsonia sp. Leaf264]|uniref:hypothetical protein n=1 Tax=Leifsonia sp. Leaf264 TaxID=1736314 RepID=UPI0006FE8226|nr:hypothetical protein [Leifsonia sp. Leaf264]KQO98733.1 hypothetical protein ASF30_11775 [Leifsonia sp. Leaf264]